MPQRKKQMPETPESRVASPETAAITMRPDADRVAMVSRRADGEPDQSDGFEVIDP